MGFFSKQPKAPHEQPDVVYAVPLAARKLAEKSTTRERVYVFYAFVSASSPEQALELVRVAVRDDGFEFIELTGRIIYSNRADWDQFVAKNFDWIKEGIPTGKQLDEFVSGVVLYSPKIVQTR